MLYDSSALIFLSTLSLRRATCLRCCAISCITISIHALLAESDFEEQTEQESNVISIHALLAESDMICFSMCITSNFISIHALLAESDLDKVKWRCSIPDFYPRSPCGERHNAGPLPTVCRDFYPRSPCGERQLAARDESIKFVFLSTLSLRRATCQVIPPKL